MLWAKYECVVHQSSGDIMDGMPSYILNVQDQRAAFAEFQNLLGKLGFALGEGCKRDQKGFFAIYIASKTAHILYFSSDGKGNKNKDNVSKDLGHATFFISDNKKGVVKASVCEKAGMPAIARQCIMTMKKYSTIIYLRESNFRSGPKGNQNTQQRHFPMHH